MITNEGEQQYPYSGSMHCDFHYEGVHVISGKLGCVYDYG